VDLPDLLYVPIPFKMFSAQEKAKTILLQKKKSTLRLWNSRRRCVARYECFQKFTSGK
jgi:hypothetical protein